MKKYIFLICGFLFLPYLANAATISPSIMELEANPGETIQTKIKIYNETDQDIYLKGYVKVFQPKGENGGASILPSKIGSQAPDWFALPLNAVALAPDETVEAPLVVTIPKTADVGGYYVAVTWEISDPKKPANQVSVISQIANLVLLKVKGQASEKLSLAEFNLVFPKIYSHLPVDFYVRLENAGNVHLKPQGFLVIKNMFGRVSQTVPLNEAGSHVLPGSVRKFEVSWNKGETVQGNFWFELKNETKQFALGRYTAQVQIEYGEKRDRLVSQEVSFWVMPWRILLIGAIMIIIIVVLKFKLKKKE
ncbi:MAG: hypothetical protein AAB791_00285 [Patescibacteria group bacterium]